MLVRRELVDGESENVRALAPIPAPVSRKGKEGARGAGGRVGCRP